MSQYSNSGIRENHSKLSPKSRKAVQKILSDTRMTYCLHEIDNRVVSYCGDGVVQAGEVKMKTNSIDLTYSYLFRSLIMTQDLILHFGSRNVTVAQQKIALLKNHVVYPQVEDPRNKKNVLLQPENIY